MRDFRAGGDINVGGDVHIIDNSAQHKLLIQCSNDELFDEREFRSRALKQETKEKWKRIATAWVGIAVVSCGVSLYLYITGDSTLAGLVLGGAGVAASLASVKVLENPNEFEARQMAALNEIRMILKERGAER
jgi:hypothetical protein